MVEQLATFSTSKLAKEKGFDLKCKQGYCLPRGGVLENVCTQEDGELYVYDDLFNDYYINKPTQSLLHKWLREVYNIDVDVWCNASGWGFNLNKTCGTSIYTYELDDFGDAEPESGMFKTYEDALEKGLMEALKIIK